METHTSLTFFLFCICWITLIAGLVIGYIAGGRMARNRERHRLIKGKIKKNKDAIYNYQKEKYDFERKIERLNQKMQNLTEESELYKEQLGESDRLRQKISENERLITNLYGRNVGLKSSISLYPGKSETDAFTLLLQMKEDPLHSNLSKAEWAELMHVTNILFNNILSELKEKSSITWHEQELCCLIKWNFSRKEQMFLFNNSTEALTKSKSRLKKRLLLDEKTDLDQYIRLY